MFVSAVVPAAGSGLRLGEPIPKPLVSLDKKPIFIHTLKALSQHPEIKEIIMVVSQAARGTIERHLKKYGIKKVKQLVIGGVRRRDSVQNGLRCISRKADMVLVHDAVRPFIEINMISRLIKQAARSGAAILGVPIKSTLKKITANKRVIRTLKREHFYEIQTPQVFKRDLLIRAYGKFPNVSAVDDSSLIERLGNRVVVVLGSYSNIKITTPEDLIFARAILKNKGHAFS
ncbi:MAG: 2-C-methyl-D-erythritol 4-phosphate cytidylyltransferase [Candidatus Omnitrophota bacterium]|jgi:2-C-methyl-D-erythritol 4-phosphate cytidylyltransferase